MTRPILDFQAAEMAADDEGLGLCYGKREFRDHLEAQAQQAVAAVEGKYQERIRVLEGELKLAAIAVADRAILNAAPMNAAFDKLFGWDGLSAERLAEVIYEAAPSHLGMTSGQSSDIAFTVLSKLKEAR